VGNSWTLTRSASPEGCHSRPALAKRPPRSLFLASTLTTGWPSARWTVGLLVQVAELRVTIGVLGTVGRDASARRATQLISP
jgi:hypothetical protein